VRADRHQRSPGGPPSRCRAAARRIAGALLCGALVSACSHVELPFDGRAYLRAQSKRAELLAREVERLRADLAQAERALAGAGLRGTNSRADAISAIAEARVALERVEGRVTWRATEMSEARARLAEADRQVDARHFGAAIFFASRAQRIVEDLYEELLVADQDSATGFIVGERVNLRAGSSTEDPVVGVLPHDTPIFAEGRDADWVLVRTAAGDVGWVHESLVRENR
jgi:hypothetical protein